MAGKGIPGVLIAPHITEKATSGASHGWYSFRVARHADKPTIKRAVEGRYGVRVLRVRVVNRQPRPIRLGRTEGSVPGYKNAMVKLREGEAIEFS
ncbi:MAG: 50S ribosomal protein L23 [Candidatus Sungbacteria bacterium RIFCSPLOWO2_01_FULL_60_25]|uniref:Large ribosomal subunit protein uL23 n=1 Tax=Candidatus Sungbacteria bacterium RIFCSPLOWO2_01_FULL_60_25 TaxID=1802281 RepID=A0A1G2L9K2_9BACT|nr:MAG: 50S ribosomal protein L23 [Candidatus Sungbacteria bacterium RIFCSPLOWO2_01_FULL_60_25]